MTLALSATPTRLVRTLKTVALLSLTIAVTLLGIWLPAPSARADAGTFQDGDFEFAIDESGETPAVTLVNYLGNDTEVSIPGTVSIEGVEYAVTVIGESAFLERGLTEVAIPDSVVRIAAGAFSSNALSSVTIPDSVIAIKDFAFEFNPLTHLTLGVSVDEIGTMAFEHYDDVNERPRPLDVVFTGPPPTVFRAPNTESDSFASFAEPEGVTISFPAEFDSSVYADGFTRPSWMGYAVDSSVPVYFDLGAAGGKMPATLAQLGEPFTPPHAVGRDGFAFAGWYLDEELSVPFNDSEPVDGDLTLYADWELLERYELVTIDGVIYMADMHDPDATAMAAGYAGKSRAVTILPEVTIEGRTFTVTRIGSYSFSGCEITSVTIPDTIKVIETGAFGPGDVTEDGELLYRSPLGDLVIPDSVEIIEDYAFLGAELTSLKLGTGIRHIGEGAFSSTGLTEVQLPTELETIGMFAFSENEITTLDVPDSVTDIDFMAFAYNPLSSVRIGAGIETIGDLAFDPELAEDPASAQLKVTFMGAPPAEVTSAGWLGSFGLADDVTIRFLWAYGAERYPDGFTTPSWRGYASLALATVSFDVNGHGDELSPVLVPAGDRIDSLPEPTASGWIFDGWFLDTDATEAFGPTEPILEDVTLYAGWHPAPKPDVTEPDLAATGAQGVPIALGAGGALLLAALGVVVLGASRRRRRA